VGYPAVIFDLDGVLVDSEPNYLASERELLAEYGIDFTEDMKVPYIGMSTWEMLSRLAAEHGLSTPVPELVERKNGIYRRLADAHTPVNEPMRRLAELLREADHPLAVASGSSPEALSVVLAATGLVEYFDAIVSAEEVERGKPQPDVFLAAAARLGVRPADCFVIEDSAYGVLAAHRAGMRSVAIPYRPDLATAEAFGLADLLIEGGMSAAEADKIFAFITA
jgi:beta-phosphoglucomutase family hydrolase